MELNITQMMSHQQFENRENQKKTIEEILTKEGATDESVTDVMDKSIVDFFDNRIYSSAQLSIMKAASKINVNDKLKETVKYLKTQPIKTYDKKPVLGELWDLFSRKEEIFSNIIDMEIDYSVKNIFAA